RRRRTVPRRRPAGAAGRDGRNPPRRACGRASRPRRRHVPARPPSRVRAPGAAAGRGRRRARATATGRGNGLGAPRALCQAPTMATTSDLFPPLGLRVRAGDLELRGLTDDDLVGLGELAVRGVHPPDRMPFYHPWTEAPAEDLPRQVAQFHWGVRARFSPESWSLDLGVWVDGELVGSQGISTQDYL